MKFLNHTIAKRLFMVATGLLYSLTGQASSGPFAGNTMQLEDLYQGSTYPSSLVNFTVPVFGEIQFAWLTDTTYRLGPVVVEVSDTGSNTAIVTLTETLPTSGNYGPSPNLAFFSAISPNMPTFTNVTLDSSTTAALFDPARVQFTGNTFSYDWGGLPILNGSIIKLDITTAFAPVPIPAAIWLFGSGLIGLLSFNRRKNKTAKLIAS